MNEKIGLLGASGQSDEVRSYYGNENIDFIAVDKQYLTDSNMIDIENPSEDQKIEHVIAAVGAPAVRKKMVESWPGKNYANLFSDSAEIDHQSLQIGAGCIIAPRAVLTTNIEVGNHALINVAATISHNCKIGDFVTISPGAHLAGNVRVGEGAFIGIGAIVSNRINIANGVVLGAGAVLVKDAEVENGVYVGNPAKLIKINDGWLSAV